MDDIVLAGANEDAIKRVKNELSNKFDIKDLGFSWDDCYSRQGTRSSLDGTTSVRQNVVGEV